MTTRTTAGEARVVTGSVTRPEDTTAYTAGDAWANATSAPAVPTIEVGLKNGDRGTIAMPMLVDSASQGTKADIEVWIFSEAPTGMEDNAAFDPSDAEMETLLCVLDFGSTPDVGKADVGAGGNCVYRITSEAYNFVCTSDSKDLHWIPVIRNAYTPVSAEKLTLILHTWVDVSV
jgi:hypothetical protein